MLNSSKNIDLSFQEKQQKKCSGKFSQECYLKDMKFKRGIFSYFCCFLPQKSKVFSGNGMKPSRFSLH